MTRRTLVVSLTMLFALSTLATLAATRTQAQITPPYKVTAIKAMLFYDGSAKFSRDVLAKPNFTFWNTIIGEGDAEAPSNSTLVLFEITGNPSASPASRKVELTATSSRKLLIKRTVDISLFGDGGTILCRVLALRNRVSAGHARRPNHWANTAIRRYSKDTVCMR